MAGSDSHDLHEKFEDHSGIARFGLPEEVVLDNCPQVASEEFAQFLTRLAFYITDNQSQALKWKPHED